MGWFATSRPAPVPPPVGRWNWNRLAQQGLRAVAEAVSTRGELSPAQVAAAVCRTLPPPLARWLHDTLTQLGWCDARALIPFDVLDRADTPTALRGPHAALVRVAVFGLPGQGLASRDRHREILFQQLCAELMRAAVDTNSLEAAASRVRGRPEVRSDPLLASMLDSFIVQRHQALRATLLTPEQKHQAKEQLSKLHTAFEESTDAYFPTRGETLAQFRRAQCSFEAAIAQFEEQRAEATLDNLRELRRRFPAHIPSEELQICEEAYDQFLKRAGEYRRQIRELAGQAMEAAAEGDIKSATWITRRLHAIHSLLPPLLSSERLHDLQNQIHYAGEQHEFAEARQELVQRERDVAHEIKDLAGVIHRFHQIARRYQPTDELYQRAEAAYRAAVTRIRTLDTDWLASLILQLEALIEDLDDPAGRLQNKLDLFIQTVRSALNRLRMEIRTIQSERQANESAE